MSLMLRTRVVQPAAQTLGIKTVRKKGFIPFFHCNFRNPEHDGNMNSYKEMWGFLPVTQGTLEVESKKQKL